MSMALHHLASFSLTSSLLLSDREGTQKLESCKNKKTMLYLLLDERPDALSGATVTTMHGRRSLNIQS
jgi:hypothetical protein